MVIEPQIKRSSVASVEMKLKLNFPFVSVQINREKTERHSGSVNKVLMGSLSVPALLWMFVSLVVEVQRDFSVQSDSKVVVHDTFLSVAVPTNTHRLKS